MRVLQDLNSLSSINSFESYISSNQGELIDLFSNFGYEFLKSEMTQFKMLSLKRDLIAELDFGKELNIGFLQQIVSTSLRLGDKFLFEIYFKLYSDLELPTNSSFKAGEIFLLQNRDAKDYITSIEGVVSLIIDSDNSESDDINSVVIFSNLYAHFCEMFYEWGEEFLHQFRDTIEKTKVKFKDSFLQHELIDKVQALVPSLDDPIHFRIHALIDNFLGRTALIQIVEGYLIEESSSYTQLLNYDFNFEELFQVNRRLYRSNPSDAVFWSLDRGVRVLSEEDQLVCYLSQLGDMHRYKLIEAIDNSPNPSSTYELYDWGCGQGIGSFLYHEKNNSSGKCLKTTLIEPSEIAIKRAAFHLSKKTDSIQTINAGFDDLEPTMFSSDDSKTKVHIFSNVLDVDFFSIKKFCEFFKLTFKGENIIIIVSPFLSAEKLLRINYFIGQTNTSRDLYYSDYAQKGEWIRTWTKYIKTYNTQL